jgi:mannose-6-phosphate isomerase-like protein (cupin superfamily)
MAKVSSATADKVEDFGVAEDRSSTVDGYTINFVTIREGMDLAPMLASLPGGRCACPHWGYLLKGEMIVRYADHEETYHAGDAFYMPPGHVPEARSGCEFVQFSPTDELAATDAAIKAGLPAAR